jgi:putative ABC transport system permease protein
MSFSVSRRTREIGIRSALGADPRRIVLAVFSRALLQVGLGVLAGASLIFLLMGGITSSRVVLVLVVPVLIMLGVCALACIVPTRRVLAVHPTDALRADA